MNRLRIRRAAATGTANIVLRIIGTPYGQRLARYVDVLHRLFNNDSGNIRLNGEAWLLSQLGPLANTVFDVGANKGSWTQLAMGSSPGASLHSFEPVPETYAQLVRSVGSSDRVHLNQLALSDHPLSELPMWTDGRDGQMSSATARPGTEGRPIIVSCTTGDEYLDSNSIDHVDLLKIDVEGHEMEVLRGFEEAFERRAIDVVQFEFTLWAAVARRWLSDYYEFFSSRGFRIGKLWPRCIRWNEYVPEDEQFFRCNYVAVRIESGAARILGAV